MIARTHVLIGLLALAGCKAPAAPQDALAGTEVGSPMGAPVTVSIGAQGGTITSADGMLDLLVPPGALAADTALSVQPLTVTGPDGMRAYRLGPEGTTFAVPATVSFHYTADDLVGTTAAALRVGYQDADRRWRVLDNALSERERTVSVATPHLSDWSMLKGWQIRPGQGRLKTNGSISLTVKYCQQSVVEDDTGGLATIANACPDDPDELGTLFGNWSVNGVAGGNATVGTVAAGNPTAVYTAPSKKPAQNPVAVSVDGTFGGNKVTLVANIEVVDAIDSYTGTVTHHSRVENDAEITGSITMDLALTEHRDRDLDKYAGTGMATFKVLPLRADETCQPVGFSLPATDQTLIVYAMSDSIRGSTDPFQSRLSFVVAALGYSSTTTCCDSGGVCHEEFVGGLLNVGSCLMSPDAGTLPKYSDPMQLDGSGSWPCTSDPTSPTSVTWTLTGRAAP